MRRSITPILAAALLAGACGSDEGGTDDRPPAICLAPGEGPYPLTFTDVTEELGLGPAGLSIAGSNVSIADIDGDRWPDVALTKGARDREDPDEPSGLYRLLRNTGVGFEDVTWSSGLFTARDGTEGRATSFLVFADLDNDGDADAFSAVNEDSENPVDDYSAVFLNDGTGTFTIGPEQSFTPDEVDPVVSAATLDYDRDGVLDLFVGHHYGTYGYIGTAIQDSLFRGDGQGGLADVTEAAGLATEPFSTPAANAGKNHKPTWGVGACDVDGDGWTDLLACSYGRQLNALYRNTGGAFEDLSIPSGFASDDDEDYTDNVQYVCFCDAHPDEPTCADAPAPTVVCDGWEDYWSPGIDDQTWRLGGNSAMTLCGDVDNDGDLDLVAVDLAHGWAGRSSDRTEILLNEGFPDAPLVRPGNDVTGLDRGSAGLNWNEGDLGGALFDFDNDGRLDVLIASSDYAGTHSLLWQQDATGTAFSQVEEEAGALVHRAHGVGVLDYDRDGDLDVLMGTSLMRWNSTDSPPPPDDAYAYLLRNDTGQDANKLLLDLTGTGAGGANRDAIGARVTAVAGGRAFVREVQGGHGLTGFQHDHLVVIGIGAACEAETVTVRWPDSSGSETVLRDVLANYVLVVEQGKDPVYTTLEQYTSP